MRKKRVTFQEYSGTPVRKKRQLSPGLLLAVLFAVLLIASWYVFPYLTVDDDPVFPEDVSNEISDHIKLTSISIPVPTFTPVPQATEQPFDFSLLVNESHPLPADYDVSGFVLLNAMETDLFTVKEPDTYADSRAVDALTEMLTAALADGISPWQISEAYRSVEAQQKIWDEKYEKYRTVNGLSEEKAIQAVKRRVAFPGCSEHHTGLAFDLTVPGKSFAGTPQAEWLNEHCYEYGFIIRYQAEKEALTGITAEPWHVRYVGKEAAAVMVRENLCLEEYTRKYR